MTKIWFSLCKNADGSEGYKLTNYPHEGSIAVDSSQQVWELCSVHKVAHLKEIKGVRAVFQCCKCRKEMNYPKFAAMNRKRSIIQMLDS